MVVLFLIIYVQLCIHTCSYVYICVPNECRQNSVNSFNIYFIIVFHQRSIQKFPCCPQASFSANNIQYTQDVFVLLSEEQQIMNKLFTTFHCSIFVNMFCIESNTWIYPGLKHWIGKIKNNGCVSCGQ